jgi:hypothetical protein
VLSWLATRVTCVGCAPCAARVSLCVFWGMLGYGGVWCLAVYPRTVYHQKLWLKDCSTGDLLGENAVLGLTADGNNAMDASALVLSYLYVLSLPSCLVLALSSCRALMSCPQALPSVCPHFASTLGRRMVLTPARRQALYDTHTHTHTHTTHTVASSYGTSC